MSADHEFKVHHLVGELVSLFRVQDTSGVESLVELLLRHRSPYVTTQVSAATAKKRITNFSSKGAEFRKKYDELHQRQVRELNPLVYLLSLITEEEQLCGYLGEICPSSQLGHVVRQANISVLDDLEGGLRDLPTKGAVMSAEELGELMGRLETVTTALKNREREKLKMTVEGNFPELPSWLFERSYLTADFPREGSSSSSPSAVSLGSLPLDLQQLSAVEDLLYLMVGVEGRFIKTESPADESAPRKFTIDKTLDPSLRSLVERILPICSSYSAVVRFIEEKSTFYEGRVNQSLSAAMRGLVKEYCVVVAQLEHQLRLGQLSLQKLWYYVQPCSASLSVLERIVGTVTRGSCRGGKTLTALHSITTGYIGEPRTQELCLHLTRAACQPYFSSLSQWIHQGLVHDPYSEFMVREHEDIRKDRLHAEYNDSYWERRYTVLQDNIPSFLESVADKILCSGKYLNVVRECGKESGTPSLQIMKYSVQERGYIEQIEAAYSQASRRLLDLILVEKDLPGYLRSIKHYFLLDQGDLFVHFMDSAGDELARPMADILPTRLESLLELALHTSLANCDPYKDNLKACLVPFDLITQLLHITAIQPEGVGAGATPPPPIARPESMPTLSGLESFSLEYSVEWPLSLVISYRSLYKYQLLFRHLFYCKHVERQLCGAWRTQRARSGPPSQPNPWYIPAFALLQRMLNFVQSFQYYMTMEVLEPNWSAFEKKLAKVSTIDDVLQAHTDFLDSSLRDCLLSDRNILKTVSRLMELCLHFSGHMQEQVEGGEEDDSLSLSREELGDSGRRMARVISVDLDSLLSPENFCQSIARIEAQFMGDLLALQDTLLELHVDSLSHMVSRLDYNSFYHSLRLTN